MAARAKPAPDRPPPSPAMLDFVRALARLMASEQDRYLPNPPPR